jgi:hypothetical protein
LGYFEPSTVFPSIESRRMNPDCLVHRLTPAEREFFNTRGYLIVENALAPAVTERLIAAADRIDARERAPDQMGKLLSFPNVIHEDPALIELIDCPEDAEWSHHGKSQSRPPAMVRGKNLGRV